jgi:hypothetical protein
MLAANFDKVEFLKLVLIFNEFDEVELERVAERLDTEFVAAGKKIFQQEDDSSQFYIIVRGEVRVTRIEKDGNETFLASFDTADTFGEDALLFNRPRSATVTAITDTELFTLSQNDFDWIRRTYPKIDPYLVAFSQTHETIRRLKIDWLNEEETISLVARRHPIRMWLEILAILVFVSFTLATTTALITFFNNARVITLLSMGTAGFVTLVGLIACIWTFFEWRNDYFFVTNLRVVWRERILFRSASRQEVPLRAIQSLDVQTPNVIARLIDIGALVIRTFNSQMLLTDVIHPHRMKDMVEAFLQKARRRTTWAEHVAIRQTIRQRLGRPIEEQPEKVPTATLKVQETKHRLTIFRTRVVEDGNITYRKHWWIFFRRAWLPSLILLASTLLSFVLTVTTFQLFSILGLLGLYFVPFGIFLWWLYRYEDWRNDIYRVTRDRIIDRDKKPFGKESFRSAPIKNIQSVGHQIPNTIGLILNVGNVHINVGDETFTFDGVHDPALVHQDISRRMEELVVATEQDRIKEEHERMATWLEIYHDEIKHEMDSSSGEHIPDFD